MKNKDSIPTIDECYVLMNEYNMRQNIVDHSEQVMRVALAIVDNLKKTVIINRDLVIAASLLHDITKTRALVTGEAHDVSGGALLRDIGMKTIASIVEAHVIFADFRPDGALEEREIVYYADKRVMHSKIVSIKERIDDLVLRYGTTNERIERIINNKSFILHLEQKINRFMIKDIDAAIYEIKPNE